MAAVDHRHPGHRRDRGRARSRCVALLALRARWRVAPAPPAPRPAARARRAGRAATWSRTPRRMQEAFEALREYVEESPRGSTGGWRASRAALRGTIAHRALVRYDAYNELSGPPVDVDRAARRRTLGDRAVVHPPPRPGARVRQAGARRAAANSSSRPRRPRRCALALAGARRDAAPGDDAGARRPERRAAGSAARRLSRPGGHVQRGGAAASAAPDAVEPVAAGDDLRHGRGAARRRGRAGRSCRSRTRSRARSASRSTCSPSEAGDVRDRRRGAAARAPLADRRRAGRAGGDRHGALPPAGARAVRAVPARRAARTRACCRRARPPRPCATVVAERATPRTGGARDARWRREIYGGTVLREGVEDRDDNETRFVWLARGDGRAGGAPPLRDGAAASAWKTSLVFWGAGADSPGWLVRCLDEFARREINLTKIESRPRRERLGSYMFFVDLAGPRARTPRRARRSTGCARCASRCACSAPTRPRAGRAEPASSATRSSAGAIAAPPRYTPALKMESTVPPEPVGSVSPSEHQRHGPETSPRTAMGGRVLVLNATYEPINVCTVRRAVVLLLKEKAELLERGALGAALRELDARAAGRDPAGHLRATSRATRTGARSPAARCSRATAGPASTAARART